MLFSVSPKVYLKFEILLLLERGCCQIESLPPFFHFLSSFLPSLPLSSFLLLRIKIVKCPNNDLHYLMNFWRRDVMSTCHSFCFDSQITLHFSLLNTRVIANQFTILNYVELFMYAFTLAFILLTLPFLNAHKDTCQVRAFAIYHSLSRDSDMMFKIDISFRRT